MTGPSSASTPTADFGSRFSAYIVDAIMLFSVQWVAVIVLSRQLQAVGLTKVEPCQSDALRMCEGPSSLLWALALLFLLATTIGYHAFFEGRYGATPGKKWLGLRVRSVDTNTSPLGYPTAALRSVIRQSFWLSLFFVFDASPLGLSLPPALFILVPLAALGLVAFAAVAPDGRGVHDRVAGTQVIRGEHDDTTSPAASSMAASEGTPEDTPKDDDTEKSEESV